MNAWIPIKDKLPEEDTPVLVTDGKIISVAQLELFGDRKSIWWDIVGCEGVESESYFDHEKVTHWMPLPKLPD